MRSPLLTDNDVPSGFRRIGVVVPVYGHSRFAVEAVKSACEQMLATPHVVAVVDDGCPNPETQHALTACRARYPGRVISLRQRNGGLSAARNTGVRTLLGLFPDTDAIFFLDADNRLENYALAAYAAALGAEDGAGWAFPDVHAFGLTPMVDGVDVRETTLADSALRHRRGNISEAGSLVRSEVFRAGVFYDETMKFGLEDWDFWLSAREAGFHGVRVTDPGFLYRVRPESMVAQSRRQTDEIMAGMQRKHSDLFARSAILADEHEEAPRFLMANLETGEIRATSDPLLPGRTLTLREAATLFEKHLSGIHEHDVPPVLVAHHGRAAADMEWPQHLRSLFFEALAEPLSGPHILSIRAADHASRFVGDTRRARKDIEAAEALIALIPLNELSRLAFERPKRPGLALVRDVTRVEHWSLPTLEQVPPFQGHVGHKRRIARLSALLRPFTRVSQARPLHHASRFYRGPIVKDVRELMADDLCGYAPFKPFPFIARGRERCLVAVAPASLADEALQDAFGRFCERLSRAGLRLSLALDGQTANPAFARAARAANFENILLDPVPAPPPSDFGFMGSDIPVQDPSRHARLMALARGHDALITFGITDFLPFAGEAKGDKIFTILTLDDILVERDAVRGRDPVTVAAAYEHAHHVIAAGVKARKALANCGVPSSRLVPTEALAFTIKSRLAR
ncbi:glycosyltransferase family 2 protein [Afifella sp. H1R]|uniref:glycosyltransferase family A protein n=1 Tax=Afifella sp. H1R TaxID=2908841 RepID=UPI001F1E3645|nr:glycosyltransferase family A protein [Afifella sp. H1R]MCF1504915.1 glycosyltransferase family 2 protein [Afifella sp. H1R]